MLAQLYIESLQHGCISLTLTPIFSDLREPLLVRVVQALRVIDFMPDELMVEKDELSDGLRWIWNGSCEIQDETGKYPIATLREGMMVGENCLVKNSPSHMCSICCTSWCNVLMLPMSDVTNILAGHQSDLHWMMCFAEERWTRFCSVVALSNLLERASALGVPLIQCIEDFASSDAYYLENILAEFLLEAEKKQDLLLEAEMKQKKLGEVEGQRNSKGMPIKPHSDLDTVQQPSAALQDAKTMDDKIKPTFQSPQANRRQTSGILKKTEDKQGSKKQVTVTARDFGNSEDVSEESKGVRASAALSKYQTPLVGNMVRRLLIVLLKTMFSSW